VHDFEELKRQGLSVQAISNMTGFDRKTVRKYLIQPEGAPVYGPRAAQPGKLDGFKPYLEERLRAGVWNGQVLLRELRGCSYTGGYTILKDWLQPQRMAAGVVAVRRFETPPGEQAQVDWEHLGDLEMDGQVRKLWGFAFTLGYSRMMMAEAALNQKLGTLLRMHEEAFRQLGGVPRELLYDRMKTVWQGTDERGEIIWNPVLLDFARYWGFRPRLCRPGRPLGQAQTKGKVESGVKYVRRNFLCGLQGREPRGLQDLNTQMRQWVWEVANQRVHGTTRPRGRPGGDGALGCRSVCHAAARWPAALPLRRRGVAQSGAGRLCPLAGEPLLGTVDLRRQGGVGAPAGRPGRPLGRKCTTARNASPSTIWRRASTS
jgi:transposase